MWNGLFGPGSVPLFTGRLDFPTHSMIIKIWNHWVWFLIPKWKIAVEIKIPFSHWLEPGPWWRDWQRSWSWKQECLTEIGRTRRRFGYLIIQLETYWKVNHSHHHGHLSVFQVGGWTQVYGDILSFATIRGASHTTTLTQPERSLALFTAFLKGQPLPE